MQTYSEFCKRLVNDLNTLIGEEKFSTYEFKRDLQNSVKKALITLEVTPKNIEKFIHDHGNVFENFPENFNDGSITQESLEDFYFSIKNVSLWKNS